MKRGYKKVFTALAFPFIGLLVLTFVIMVERQGLQYNLAVNVNKSDVLADGSNVAWEDIGYTAPLAQGPAECLVIADTAHEYGMDYLEVATFTLDDMQVSYDLVDLKDEAFPDLTPYQNCVLVISDLTVIGDDILNLFDWVRQGGHLTNTGVFDTNVTFQVVANKLGIVDGGAEFCVIDGFRVMNDFMLGGKENGETKTFVFNEPMPAALAVNLVPECDVYLESDTGVPLLWGVNYGAGKMVINNFSIVEKAARGIFAAAYSALDDIGIYPVINASCYFLDDFPSPVPVGENEYIAEDYGCDVNTFYTNIWWPDVMAWQSEYGIKHTGVIIEDYNDMIEAPLEQQDELARFIFFGNMLLKDGGELGFHGYNHMPLVYDNFDYEGLYDEYTPWKSEADMVASITELNRFASKLFKNESFTVYVPPSNILSEEGREVLVQNNPQLRIIASTYYKDACSYEQEFGIDEDGIIRLPRITSGCTLDDFQELMAFSELNFHYVQTHFLHPDDVLDPNRGGEIGWEQMEQDFHKYLNWITQAAPKLRQLTATGAGVAVEQYAKLNYTRTDTPNAIELNIGGFGKQAYFMMRINNGRTVEKTDGGSIEHLTGNLYAIKAEADKVTIHLEA